MENPVRIMPCLDMQNGRVAKGVHFVDIKDAGKLAHFHEAVEAGATILLAASMFHFGMIQIGELKPYLREWGVAVK